MAAEGLNGDWVEAEIAHQLELISIEDDSNREAGGEESIHQQVQIAMFGATPPVAVAMIDVNIQLQYSTSILNQTVPSKKP